MNEELIVKKLLDHDERFDRLKVTMMTKADKVELLTVIENLAAIVHKIREDQVLMIEWMSRRNSSNQAAS